MRLHLPQGLRAALLACMGMVSSLASSVPCVAFTAGIAAFALHQTQAADYTITSSDDSILVNAGASDTITMNLEGYLYSSSTTVNATLNITKMIITNASSNKTYNFNGSLTGSGVITLDLAGTAASRQTWNFNGDVSGYTGAITINGGSDKQNILSFTGDSTINASSITTDYILRISGTRTITSTVSAAQLECGSGVTFSGSGAVVSITGDRGLSGEITLRDGATIQVNRTDSLNYSGQAKIILESGGVVNFNDKRWTVGSNNYFVLRGGSITGTGDGNGSLDFLAPGTNPALSAEVGNSVISAPLKFRTSGQIQTINVEDGATLTINGNMFGDGGFKKTGAGELIVSSQSSYLGGTTIEKGGIRLTEQGRLGTGQVSIGTDGTLLIDGGAIAGKIENEGGVVFGSAASVDLSVDLFELSDREKEQGNGYGGGRALLEDIISGTGSITGIDSVAWSCNGHDISYSDGAFFGEIYGGCYYIYTTPSQDDLNELPNANRVFVGENAGEVKLVGNVKAGIEVTVESGSTWDINGNKDTS
ncbi:MAG: hypothetical protein ACI4XO_08750, partial [Akkermansia sp.]